MNPNCPIHVGVKMRRESVVKKASTRPGAKAEIVRFIFCCRVFGCPRVEEGKVFYSGKTWAGDFLEN